MSIKFEISPKEFDIEFMREHGYVRKKCRFCGAYFWTVDPDREDCGEPPCSGYGFIGNPPTRRRYTVSEMREAFLRFFERHGHTVIKPYPVVARWRDDLLITIASIADFQPFVTSGISEPPANPLVISQPCLRFEDIHNVGLTAGRHLTIFEMGGAHAFNKRDRVFYWKNETIGYHHMFATEELGIPGDEIIYKEHFWVGGGNAGPDVEGVVRGLEVSTLVFMQYRVVDDRLEETPILTVDTGYGIERWAWLSSGTPTAFHVIYGGLVGDVLRWAGVEVDERMLVEDALASGAYRADEPERVREARAAIARRLGYPEEEVAAKLSAFNSLMALLDHVKAAIFLIKDGALPSNVKEGYLTRLLLRRAFRIIEQHGLWDYLDELLRKQVDLWGRDFPDVREAGDTIFEVVGMEVDRYRKVLRRGREIIRGIVRKMGGIGLDDLILLYDSHGIPPDYVAEVAGEMGVAVEVPPDFHARVAARHQRPEERPEARRPVVEESFETRRLYYEDPYMRSAEARVLWVGGRYVILDRTVFYPEGGGQLGDTGWLLRDGERVRIVDTISVDGNIVHVADRDVSGLLKPGDVVKCVIDWERRYSLMRNHTATHILMGAIKRVLGRHVWQAGAEKRPEQARLDVTHHRLPTEEEVRRIEELANEVVRRGIETDIRFMERGEAERLFGPQIYQGGVVPGKYVRIVRVGDWDTEACGGTHVRNTSEVLTIKIVGVERIHEGVIRFTFKTGPEAIRYLSESHEILRRISRRLGVSREEAAERVESLLKELESLKKRLRSYESELRRYMAEELYLKAEAIGPAKLVVRGFDDVDEAIEVGERLEKEHGDILFVGVVNMERGFSVSIFSGRDLRDRGITARKALEAVSSLAQCRGGKGDDRYYRAGGPGNVDLGALKEAVRAWLSRALQG